MTGSAAQESPGGTRSPVDLVAHRTGIRLSLYLLATLATLFALYTARSLLMPIVVALLFSLMLSPLVALFKRFYIPRALSSVLLLGLLIGPFVFLSIQLAVPAQKWMQMVPEIAAQATQELTELGTTLSPEAAAPAKPLPERETGFSFSRFFKGDTDQPVEPEAEEPKESALVEGVKKGGMEIILAMLGAAPFIVAQGAIWLILVLFLLIFGPGLYANVINLAPMITDKRRTMLLVGRLRQQLSRYVLTVTIINAALGFVTGLVLWLFGVEDALLWGAVVGLLNYAPYVGPFIAICVLSIAGLAQYGLNLGALLPAAIFFGINMVESQIVTPTVLGQHMRLNPLILILWLLIWGSLWGPVGLLIGVPLLVCLKLIAAHVDNLNYLVELVETET